MGSQTKSATVYIIRHGETIGNDKRILLDPVDDVLNEIGKYQTKRLAETTLKDVVFTHVFTSPFPRTRQTAGIVLEQNSSNSKLIPEVNDNLGEIDLKNCFGKPYQYIFASVIKFLNSGKPIDEFELDGSEPVPDARQRAKNVMTRLIEYIGNSTLDTKETILVVSHGGILKLLMEEISNNKDAYDIGNWNQNATSITRNTGLFKMNIEVSKKDGEIGKPKIVFEKVHDFSHFPEELLLLKNDSLARMTQTPEGKCLSGCFQV